MLDPATWGRARLRVVSLLVLGAAALLALGAALAWSLSAGAAAKVAWVLVAPLLALLAIEVAILVRAPREPSPTPAPSPLPPPSPSPAPLMTDEAPVLEETLLTLRCGHCGTVFEVPDTGERPLRSQCPGCGTEGVVA